MAPAVPARTTINLNKRKESVILSEASEYQRAAFERAESIQKQVEGPAVSRPHHHQSQRKRENSVILSEASEYQRAGFLARGINEDASRRTCGSWPASPPISKEKRRLCHPERSIRIPARSLLSALNQSRSESKDLLSPSRTTTNLKGKEKTASS
jgi:hypothetical protein